MDAVVDSTLSLFDEVQNEFVNDLTEVLSTGTDLAVVSIADPYTLLPFSFYENIRNVLIKVWMKSGRATELLVNDAFTAGKATKADAEQAVLNFVTTHGGPRITGIADQTKNIVIQKVRRGLARGQSLDSLVRQIVNESPQFNRTRAELIVANEVHTVSQYTSQFVAQNSGLLLLKVWNSVKDDRTRRFDLIDRSSQFNHLVMDGQTRPLFDSFSVPTLGGGFELIQYPGDPAGSAGNTINCRCVQTYKEAL